MRGPKQRLNPAFKINELKPSVKNKYVSPKIWETEPSV